MGAREACAPLDWPLEVSERMCLQSGRDEGVAVPLEVELGVAMRMRRMRVEAYEVHHVPRGSIRVSASPITVEQMSQAPEASLADDRDRHWYAVDPLPS